MNRTVEVLIVGAGPAGLALAARLAGSGAGRVEVLEREQEAGGAPRHCRHGLGWDAARPLRSLLHGPSYARECTDAAVDAGAASVPGSAPPAGRDP